MSSTVSPPISDNVWEGSLRRCAKREVLCHMVVTIWDLGQAHLNVTANNIFLMQLNYMEVLQQHNFFLPLLQEQ